MSFLLTPIHQTITRTVFQREKIEREKERERDLDAYWARALLARVIVALSYSVYLRIPPFTRTPTCFPQEMLPKPAAYAVRRVATMLLCARTSGSSVPPTVLRVKRTADQLTGQADISRAQEGVRQLREQLRGRRLLLQSTEERYKELQQKLKEHYERKIRVYDTKKRDLASLALIHEEELRLLEEDQQLEKEMEEGRLSERQCFEALCEAIQDSHEREREYGQRAKLFTALASSVSAVLGFLGSYLFLRQGVKRKLHEFECTLADLGTKLEREATAATMATVNDSLQAQSGLLKEVLNTQSRVLKVLERATLVNSTHTRGTVSPSSTHRRTEEAPHKIDWSAEADQMVAVTRKHVRSEEVWILVVAGVLKFVLVLFSR